MLLDEEERERGEIIWQSGTGHLKLMIDSSMPLMFAAISLQDYKELNSLLKVLGAQHNAGLVCIQQ